jgi:hypothetical protein
MTRDLNTLAPVVRKKWQLVVADCERMGIKVMVIETRRTKRLQMAYWSQGRDTLDTVNLKRNAAGLLSIKSHQNKIITRTQESIHFYDCALDFALVIDGKPSWDTKADINNDDVFDYGNVGHIAVYRRARDRRTQGGQTPSRRCAKLHIRRKGDG